MFAEALKLLTGGVKVPSQPGTDSEGFSLDLGSPAPAEGDTKAAGPLAQLSPHGLPPGTFKPDAVFPDASSAGQAVGDLLRAQKTPTYAVFYVEDYDRPNRSDKVYVFYGKPGALGDRLPEERDARIEDNMRAIVEGAIRTGAVPPGRVINALGTSGEGDVLLLDPDWAQPPSAAPAPKPEVPFEGEQSI